MMQFASNWFDFKESENDSYVVSKSGVANCRNSVQEKLVDCFDVVKKVEENVKNVEENDKVSEGINTI